MKKTLTNELREAYAQGHAARSERNQLRILVHIAREFTYQQIMHLLPPEAELVTADAGEPLLDAYARIVPDMLIIDFKDTCPDELDHIHALDSEQFIIFLADEMPQKDILDTLQAGAQGFLTMPFTTRKLNHYIKVLKAAKAYRSEKAKQAATIH